VPGQNGSDASVTSANITTALGFTPDNPTAPRTPNAHTHAVADVTGLQTALDGKQASGSYVITTDSRLSDARTPTAHTHTKSQITDFPTLATVATSGSYADLSNKPSIPSAQVNSDWNAASGAAQILNKPTIPAATTDASLLTSGTLSDSRLSANVSLDDINNNFSASQTFAGSANTAPNQTAASGSSLMTRDLVGFEKILNLQPIHTGVFTSAGTTGSGTGITAAAPNLRLDSASTGAFGSITAVYNTELRAGNISAATLNFGTTNFDTPNLTFLFNVQSGGNNGFYTPASQSWGISIGLYTATPTGDLTTLFPASGNSVFRGYIGISCVAGNVTITAQRGTNASVQSSTLDTISGSFARQYALVKNGSSLQLYSDRSLLGSVAEYPTGNLGASLYINHTATAVSSATQRRFLVKDSYITW
jgi:hypothetical protein